MSLPKVGVVGAGFVGMAVAKGFNLFADVKVYDIDPRRSTHSLEQVLSSEFVFLCLPTPMTSAEGGECNLSIIEGFFSNPLVNLVKYDPEPIFIIKSTVPVGTTRKLQEKYPTLKIVHSPEFLTARAALIDFITPARNIVGGPLEVAEKVAGLLRQRFPGVTCYTMSSDESEMVKYAANCFFATKVMFFNEMLLLAEKLGLNWEKVIEGVMSDGRIAKSHYQVPGHDGDKGFGGTCFPKDINAMINLMEAEGIDPKVLKAVWEQNKAIRKNWDWATSSSAVKAKE